MGHDKYVLQIYNNDLIITTHFYLGRLMDFQVLAASIPFTFVKTGTLLVVFFFVSYATLISLLTHIRSSAGIVQQRVATEERYITHFTTEA